MNKIPSSVSQSFMSCQFAKMPGMTFAKAEPRNFSPRTSLICENITVVAAAEQKPEMTGPDMKSIMKPDQTLIRSIR